MTATRVWHSEDRVGSLEAGERADLAVLDMQWQQADKALQTKVLETWFTASERAL
ncbi:hypothetical protein LX36DRAFT_717229 [Colletotrichum falcatum]|nr:hypothetical protein LX36DRAFT_717229 [Colletotrichum falcatum]